MIDDLYSARLLKLAANMPRLGRLPAPDGDVWADDGVTDDGVTDDGVTDGAADPVPAA